MLKAVFKIGLMFILLTLANRMRYIRRTKSGLLHKGACLGEALATKPCNTITLSRQSWYDVHFPLQTVPDQIV